MLNTNIQLPPNLPNIISKFIEEKHPIPNNEFFKLGSSDVQILQIKKSPDGDIFLWIQVAHIPKNKVIPEDIMTHPDYSKENKNTINSPTTLKSISNGLAKIESNLNQIVESETDNSYTLRPFHAQEVLETYDDNSVSVSFTSWIVNNK